MKRVQDQEKMCCGCGLCSTQCPVGAIKMTSDELGFLYPEINTEICIKCDKCRRICIFASDVKKGVETDATN